MGFSRRIYERKLSRSEIKGHSDLSMKSFLSKYRFNPAIFSRILNQLNEPALILDEKKNIVILVNHKLELLTSFNQDDLFETKIDDLLEKKAIDLKDTSKPIFLRRKDKTIIEFKSIIDVLDDETGLLLMRLLPINGSINIILDIESFYQILGNAFLNSTNGEPGILLEKTIILIKELFNSSSVCCYGNGLSKESLVKIRSDEKTELFPKEIRVVEIDKNKLAVFWKADDRAITEIQRVARENEISFLAQVRLEITEKDILFFVIAFRNKIPSNNDFCYLPLFFTLVKAVYSQLLIAVNNTEKNHHEVINDAFYKKVVENIRSGIILIGKDGNILQVNSLICRLFGYSEWELIGTRIKEILPVVGKESLKLNNSTESITTTEILNKRDGSQFAAHCVFVPFLSDPLSEDELIYAVVVEDLSQIKELESEITQLQRQAETGVLMASFAHDVRNVFNSIKLNAETVEMVSQNVLKIKEKMIAIKEDCDRVNQLMESVLSFSSSIEKNLQPMDFQVFVERIVERWKPKLERMKIKTILQSSGELPLIPADSRSLEQVINNLISNARDAMSINGGMLGIYLSRISTSGQDAGIEFRISDSGPGIPQEINEKIFDPFFTARPGGTGLGLAICRKIVNYHQGSIHVESFPGGTSFIVRLPAKNKFGAE
jgi:PAS domain S-box-containing protein